MSKIKGLVSSIKGNEEASAIILPYNKKIQEYQKIIKRIDQVYDKIIIQPQFNFSHQLFNINKTALENIKSLSNKPEFYILFVELMNDVQKCYKNSNSQIKDYSQIGFKAIFSQCDKMKTLVNDLYEKLKINEHHQLQLIENSKKYAKNHKNFLQSIQSYKVAFQNVKLIYNNQQKIKRYKVCSSMYSAMLTQIQDIDKHIQALTLEREGLKVILQNFRQKSLQFIRIVGQQIIKLPSNMVKCLMKSKQYILKLLKQKQELVNQKSIKISIQKFRLPYPYPEHFETDIGESQNALFPNFLSNIKNLKTENFGNCKKLFLEYYNSTREDISQRQKLIETAKNYFTGLNTIFEKLFVNQQKDVKQLLSQKYMKIIQSNFFCSHNDQKSIEINQSLPIIQTLKSVVSFMDEQKQLSKNMNKLYSQQLKQLLLQLEEQNKLLSLFKEGFKTQLYKLFQGKKQFKKDLENLKSGQLQGLQLSEEQIKQLREQIIKKSEAIVVLVKGFSEKFKIISIKQKSLIKSFLEIYSKHLGYQKDVLEKYKRILENYSTILFESRSKQSQKIEQKNFWLDQNSLYQVIVSEHVRIKFDMQIDKINDFKKLKKPVADYDQKNAMLTINSEQSPQNSPRQFTMQNSQKKSLQDSQTMSASSVSKLSDKKIERKESGIGPFKIFFNKNYEQFVHQNLKFEEEQQYVSNFTCGLADNIIVSGRLYITSHRLFFHSRFNSSNIFFGGTKLEIPKDDIKKIEKRYNAIIFDNSISITTVNGQIFFTSFASRDKAFELICKTFDINNDENVFISEESIQEVQQNAEDFQINIEQQDDLLDTQLQCRALKIDELIEKDQKSDQKTLQVPYKDILSWEMKFPGLNAVKLFKIFDSGQQMPYKNKTYESFQHYFKVQVNKNQQTQILNWQPNILQYLNPGNIKQNAPLKFSRRVQTNVPAPQTSVPFMPKFIHSLQNSDLYFYSKNKYVIINKCQSSKAPYTDCFHLRYKKLVESIDQDTVKVQISMKLVFIKKTMVQGMIQSRTLKETIHKTQSNKEQMKKYLKYLQNTLIRKNNAQKIQDSKYSEKMQLHSLPSNQRLNDDEEQIQNLEKQNKIVKQRFKSQEKQKKTWKIAFLASLLFNLLFLLIILFSSSQNSLIEEK